jgi:hypothetical protein
MARRVIALATSFPRLHLIRLRRSAGGREAVHGSSQWVSTDE